MSLGPQLIARGNIDSSFLLAITLTPAQTTNNATVEQSFTVPGLQPGDAVTVSFNGAFTSALDVANARVSAANTLTLAFQNNTGGALTYPSGQFLIEVNRPSTSFTMTGIQ
jgi:hypothetical protein